MHITSSGHQGSLHQSFPEGVGGCTGQISDGGMIRLEIVQFELFELIPLLKLDK